MENKKFLTIDGKKVQIQNERNLLELIRKAGIELPTFCYHSELSVYGACRLCVVEIEGKGVITSCSIVPEPDMVVKTNTRQLREMRKIYLQLLLANHHQSCTTCNKSGACKLQNLAGQMGIEEIPFKPIQKDDPVDQSNPSLVRDPNKCVLCGDCVRACSEIQSIGAIDFAHRGANTMVLPAFGKDLCSVECVYCGLCASVCPTGAITPKNDLQKVYDALEDPDAIVIAQVAPAVRVALGELFGLEPGTNTMGKIVTALKHVGFQQVYDTGFAADLTVLEETNEFIERKTKEKKLPLFTSCCPAWVQFAEQYYPELLTNLSSCKSPQQMFGSVAKETLPELLKTDKKNIFLVSIMPCTAKKFEAARDEFKKDHQPDVDAVITTQELGKMIKQAGLVFEDLQPESLDLPLGFKTGAGVIFATTGGVSEAVLRYASEKLNGVQPEHIDFQSIRSNDNIRTASIKADGLEIKMAIVHGLKNARKIAEQVKNGQCQYDFIEVMACPGGCIAGAGQPVSFDPNAKAKRCNGIYENDKCLQLHKPQDNPYIAKCYEKTFGQPGSHKAHETLHTSYKFRKRIDDMDIEVSEDQTENKVPVKVCLGTSCYIRGGQDLLQHLMDYIKQNQWCGKVDLKATFCMESCDRGPTVTIGENVINKCTFEKAVEVLNSSL